HTALMPPWQTPAVQASELVQASPSSQGEPFVFCGFEQAPVFVSQVPTVWHWSCAEQTTEFPPLHTPLWHVSVCVHALPSSHVVPSFFAGFEQAPVFVSQLPGT